MSNSSWYGSCRSKFGSRALVAAQHTGLVWQEGVRAEAIHKMKAEKTKAKALHDQQEARKDLKPLQKLDPLKGPSNI